MKYAVVYDSVTGNTEQLAETIREVMGKEECIFFGTADKEETEAVSDVDIIFLGFWTDKGDCSEKACRYMERLTGRKVFLFGTAGFGGSQQYFSQILTRVAGHLPKGNVLAGSFMCQGRMPAGVRKRYENMLEKNPQDEKTKMMIENFDKAQTHPDEEDLTGLKKAVEETVFIA